jgi:hypothetical protein
MHSIRTKRLIFFDHVQCHMCPTRLARLRVPGQADITSDSVRRAGSIESIELNRPRPATAEEERIKALEREVRTLRKANEILRLASAFSLRGSSTAASSREGIYRSVSPCLRRRASPAAPACRGMQVAVTRTVALPLVASLIAVNSAVTSSSPRV